MKGGIELPLSQLCLASRAPNVCSRLYCTVTTFLVSIFLPSDSKLENFQRLGTRLTTATALTHTRYAEVGEKL